MSAVEVCAICHIAGCHHIRGLTGTFTTPVSAGDLDALVAELRAERDTARAEVMALRRQKADAHKSASARIAAQRKELRHRASVEIGRDRAFQSINRRLREEIAALRASAGKVEVKPLQFEGHNGFWRADDGIGGYFEVTEVGGAFHMCRIVHGHANKLIPYRSQEAAFAACQVEHARRIRSALADTAGEAR